MTAPRPPRLATMLLARLGPVNAPLIGDLLETYCSKPSPIWYWRQVLIAIGMSVIDDITTRPLTTIRSVMAGWAILLAFYAGVGNEMSRFASGWVLDRLILARWDALANGSDTFVMLFATRLYSWPASIAGFLLSGSLVVRLHRRQAASALVVFGCTIVAVSTFANEIISSGAVPREWRYLFVLQLTTGWPGFLLVWALVLAGGLCGTARSRSIPNIGMRV